jgi:hypothetical protein
MVDWRGSSLVMLAVVWGVVGGDTLGAVAGAGVVNETVVTVEAW